MPSDAIDAFAHAWGETLDPGSREKLERRLEIIGPALVADRDPTRAQLAAHWLTDTWEPAWITAAPGPAENMPEVASAAMWRVLKVTGDHRNSALCYDAIRAAASRAMIDSGWACGYAVAREALSCDDARRTWQCSSLRAVAYVASGVTDGWRRTDEPDAGQIYSRHFTAAHEKLQTIVGPLRGSVLVLLDQLIGV